MSLTLFQNRPVMPASAVDVTDDRIPIVDASETGDDRHHVISPTALAAAIAALIPDAVSSVSGKTGVVILSAADVGLGNVNNTTDLGKPISTLTQTALDGKAATSHTHTETGLVLSDVTTNDASISRHGFLPKLPGGTTTFLRADGTFASAGQTYTAGTGLTLTGTVFSVSTAYAGQTSITTVGALNAGSIASPFQILGATMALGSDATGDLYYRNAGGLLVRLAIGADGFALKVASGLPSWVSSAGGPGDVVGPSSSTNTHIVVFDGTTGKLIMSGSSIVALVSAASPVNQLSISNSPTTFSPNISAIGTDTNIGIGLVTKGTGTITYNGVEVGFRIIPQNSQSAAYTTVLSDGGKHIFHPSADTTARVWTIDSNANVAYPVGTAITFINQNGAGSLTIAITSDTLRIAGTGLTGSRTLAANGIATAIKVTTIEWIISGTGLS